MVDMVLQDFKSKRDFVEEFYSSFPGVSEEEVDEMKEMLKDLESRKVTKELLTSSKIGVSVNKLRKVENAMIQEAATKVLMKWKDLMIAPKRKLHEAEEKEEVAAVATEDAPQAAEPARQPSSPSDDGEINVKKYFLGNEARDKCLEMFVAALMVDQEDSRKSPDEIVLTTAQSIERSLFEEFGSPNSAYKSKFRSKYLNLKDRKNPPLRSALISGLLGADKFISMTAAEMASEERRQVDQKIAEQNLLNAQMAKDNAAETDQFKCGRCHLRKCKYYQMQTRSADEPMTTFVTCVNCGNRWRFC